MSQIEKENKATRNHLLKNVDMCSMAMEKKKKVLAADIEKTERAPKCLTVTMRSEIGGNYSFMILRADVFHLYKANKNHFPIEFLGKFDSAEGAADAIFTYIDEKEKESKSDEYEYEQN